MFSKKPWFLPPLVISELVCRPTINACETGRTVERSLLELIPQCPIKTLNLISSSFAEITQFKFNLKLAQPIPKVGLQCGCYANILGVRYSDSRYSDIAKWVMQYMLG